MLDVRTKGKTKMTSKIEKLNNFNQVFKNRNYYEKIPFLI